MSEYLLEMNNITKIFPGVKALDGVHFNLRKGEIHALMGENGAGKSTFIKVLTGVHQPDGGEIILDGELIHMHDPLVAARHGIAAIYQHLAAYPDLTVAENIFMGHEKLTGLKSIRWKQTNAEARRLLRSLGSDISPTERMGVLSVAQQQLVEIAKALSQDMRILIMDEPTAALSRRESEELYEIARGLRDRGISIILISHRFEDMHRLADRVTVLRDAKYIGTWTVGEVTEADLVKQMVGRSIDQYFPKKTAPIGEELLKVEGLSRTGFFADVSFTLHAGEILGLTGLVGAGRTEVVEAVCGVTRKSAGRIFVEGREVDIRSPNEALKLGVGLLPEDRQKQGLLLAWSIGRNITLPAIKRFTKRGLIREAGERKEAEHFKTLMKIRATSIDDTAMSLSGGNQQKVVVSKLLSGESKILILDEPTKGVDVGSKAQMYEIMCELAAKGFGILLISSELPEVINMADNIIVMREGRVSTVIPRAEATQENVLSAGMPVEKMA
ncbi:MAG: sugar ABC transporter ATP-binding protein [Clostridiales bacterium]|nr:sugar ABC transporter ATP-binding protein [Clostridiales bacterium]OPZ69407.1 MAG: Ribose import ATP-binding protein RbsA [Firmicutes bacterium ADurb.Bin467]